MMLALSSMAKISTDLPSEEDPTNKHDGETSNASTHIRVFEDTYRILDCE